MNWYEHHIKDYDSATAHLSWDEDMAYTRMLRWYYRQERPLPPDLVDVCRLVRAATDLQRQAVEQVLREFFVLQADGYHQGRADEVLAAFRAGQPERDAKKANEATRLAKHREERAELFRQLTAAGVHLPWNARIDTVRKAVADLAATPPATPAPAPVPSAPKPATQTATGTATPATATHPPVPIPQPPPTSISRGGAGGDSPPSKSTRRCPPDWNPGPELMAWARAQRVDIDVSLELAKMRDHHFATGRSDWSAVFRNWIRSAAASPGGRLGATPETRLARERREQFSALTGGLASARAPTPPATPATLPGFDDEPASTRTPTPRVG